MVLPVFFIADEFYFLFIFIFYLPASMVLQ